MQRQNRVLIIVIFTILFGCVSVPFLIVDGQALPHVIFGTVVDDNGQSVSGITVRVQNQRTQSTITNVTNANGQYVVDLANAPGGFHIGDNILVEANNDLLQGSSEVTVSTEPLDQCDLVLTPKSTPHPSMILVLVCVMTLPLMITLHRRFLRM